MNHNLYNFYVFVDNENKLILDKIQKLPENWRNIAGLPGLSDEEIRELVKVLHSRRNELSILRSEYEGRDSK